ncbi:MAG: hypothetical protein SGJ18_10170 [Pseudomonadota bacterium]|nr:hypothetical protein [Pseudomonadota bacterium]
MVAVREKVFSIVSLLLVAFAMLALFYFPQIKKNPQATLQPWVASLDLTPDQKK